MGKINFKMMDTFGHVFNGWDDRDEALKALNTMLENEPHTRFFLRLTMYNGDKPIEVLYDGDEEKEAEQERLLALAMEAEENGESQETKTEES